MRLVEAFNPEPDVGATSPGNIDTIDEQLNNACLFGWKP